MATSLRPKVPTCSRGRDLIASVLGAAGCWGPLDLGQEERDEAERAEAGSAATESEGAGDEIGVGWAPLESPAGGNDIGRVQFFDADRGWLAAFGAFSADFVAAGAYWTDDGGVTWQPRKLEIDAIGVSALSPDGPVWVITSEGPLWRSDDGLEFRPLARDMSDFMGGVLFVDERDGFATSEVGDRVWVTHDGGETWARNELGRQWFPGVDDVTVYENHVWLVSGPDSGVSPGSGASILHSPDRGRTWDPVVELIDEAHDYLGGALKGVRAFGPDDVWVVGRNRQLYHGSSVNNTWVQRRDVPSVVTNFVALDRHGDHLAAVSWRRDQAVIYDSLDAGQTWRASDAASSQQIRGLAFAGPDKVVCYGLYGTLLVYEFP